MILIVPAFATAREAAFRVIGEKPLLCTNY